MQECFLPGYTSTGWNHNCYTTHWQSWSLSTWILAPQTHSLQSLLKSSTLVHENKFGSYSNRPPTECVWSLPIHGAYLQPVQSCWFSVFIPTHPWPICQWLCIFFRWFGGRSKVSMNPQRVDHPGLHGYSWMILGDTLSMDDNPQLCSCTPQPNRFCSELGWGEQHTKLKHHTWHNTFCSGLPIDAIPEFNEDKTCPTFIERKQKYQSIVGLIGWLAQSTGPDLAPSHLFLSAYCS